MSAQRSMPGRTLGRYRILEQIGAGGMGTVYRAYDSRLERDVALKILPPGTWGDAVARKRFRKEALALSRLNHPAIASVFDFDTQDEIDFLVTELVGGETLFDRVLGGPLPESEVISIGTQLADGLEAAHRQGVIHCDLKPANLKLTPDGRLKILDFGLAQIRHTQNLETVTSLDMNAGAGTLPYMSPEQLQGRPPDERTDLWAAGVLLYEVSTGMRPFSGKSNAMVVDGILHSEPVAPCELKPELSRGFEQVVLRCLQKAPRLRYQTASQLGQGLRTVGNSQLEKLPSPRGERKLKSKAIRSLVVLPLRDLSAAPQQAYFSEGMTEALISELANITSLKVISRTSAMQYRETTKPLTQIAAELRVDAVVEGSVLRISDDVRITAQLISGATDSHIWGESYERSLGNIIQLQHEIAHAIATQIQARLRPRDKLRGKQTPVISVDAYDQYLKGRYEWSKITPEGQRRAIEFFEMAITERSLRCLAYSGIADAYVMLGILGTRAPREVFTKAKAAAETALELDEGLAEAHASLGFALFYYDWAWQLSEKHFRRAIGIKRSYAQAHQHYSIVLAALGRFKEAISEAEIARDLDPLSIPINSSLGFILHWSRKQAEAIRQLKATVAMESNHYLPHFWLGQVYAAQRLYTDAISEFSTALRLSPTNLLVAGSLAHSYGMAGDRQEALRGLAHLQERSGNGQYVSPYLIAIIHVGLGDDEQAFYWLERAFEDRSTWMCRIAVEPWLDPLRTDARFVEMLRRLALPTAIQFS